MDAPVPCQLALALPHSERLERDDFLEGAANRDALALIDRWPDWPGPVLALVGPEGAGKSHLAAIWAKASGARRLSAHALDSTDPRAALATGALVLEDVAADGTDERALFHLLNLVGEEGAWLLLTARAAPSVMAWTLPDLRSRMRAAPAVALTMPDDALLRAVLAKLFFDRQIKADEPLLNYLISRMERSYGAARAVAETLDGEALRRQRPLTRALAAEIFAEGDAARQ